ncbi:MAG: 6-phosphogluconolactonase [Archangium sp.]|nr:6-phosphogluconolactonase [Archangium sp.]
MSSAGSPPTPSAQGPLVERFTKGDAIGVDVAGIERELAALWRQSAQGTVPHPTASAQGPLPVMRACSWNLVVYAESVGALERARALAELVVDAIPSRALIIHHERDAVGGSELDAYVSARCKLLPGGGKMLCTEEITLESRRTGVEFLPSLTRALLVPDIPTAVLCVGVPAESVLLEELVGVADRVVFDSHGVEVESTRHLGAKAIDLAWLRIARWQLAVANSTQVIPPKFTVTAPAEFGAEARWMAAWLRARTKAEVNVSTGPLSLGERVWGEGAALFLSDAEILTAALSPRVLTPAWEQARVAMEWTPGHGTSASWNDFAARFAKAANAAIAERGVFTCALTGGSAVKMYPLLAKEKLDWSRIELYLSDERLVPLESPDSNYRAAREALPMAKLHPVRVALNPEAAAADYARQLPDQLDLIHLGMGPDGHVASLFPEHALLSEKTKRVAAVTDSPKPPLQRVTFTLPTFRSAREVWFLVVGESKRAAAHEARFDAASKLPAALVHRAARSATWFLDL